MSEDHAANQDDAAARRQKNDRPATGSGGESEANGQRGTTRLRRLVMGFLIGSVIGIVAVVGVVVFMNRGQLPIMKPAEFQAAESRWKEHGPASYDLDMEGTFDLGKGHTHVEVRKGEVTAMTIDGKPSPERQWKYYSVPGLFGVIGDDLEQNETAAKNPAGGAEPLFQQQAEFDLELGYPRRYQRTVLKSNQTGDWRIVAFKRVD